MKRGKNPLGCFRRIDDATPRNVGERLKKNSSVLSELAQIAAATKIADARARREKKRGR